MSKVIGFLVLVVGIVGLVFAVAGAWVSYQAVDSVVDAVDSLGNAFDQTLEYVSETVSGTEIGTTLEGRVEEINNNVDQTQVNLTNQLRTVRAGLILLFIWFGLLQLLPIYAGVDLMKDGMLGSKVL